MRIFVQPEDEDILAYMKNNRNDTAKADELFEYFKNVIRWVKRLFPTYNSDMKKVKCDFLCTRYHNNMSLSSAVLERQVKYFRDDVGNGNNDHLKSANGIYEYVLAIANGEAPQKTIKYLQPRAFNDKDKKAQYERQRHVCPHCMKRFENITWMVGDHIVPYNPIPTAGQMNGPTTPDNLQMLCYSCNLDKTNKPFNKAAEEQRLQNLYAMTDDEVAALPEGSKEDRHYCKTGERRQVYLLLYGLRCVQRSGTLLGRAWDDQDNGHGTGVETVYRGIERIHGLGRRSATGSVV